MTSIELKSIAEQGKNWIQGEPKHNFVRDECCPDFSCCTPSLFEHDRTKRIEIHNEWALKNNQPLWTDS